MQRLSLYSYFTSTTRSKQSWTADDDAYYDGVPAANRPGVHMRMEMRREAGEQEPRSKSDW